MRFIRDIIFEKRAAKSPLPADWAEDRLEPAPEAELPEPAPSSFADTPPQASTYVLSERAKVAVDPMEEYEPEPEADDRVLQSVFRNVTGADTPFDDEASYDLTLEMPPSFKHDESLLRRAAPGPVNAFAPAPAPAPAPNPAPVAVEPEAPLAQHEPFSAFGRGLRPEARPAEPEMRRPAPEPNLRQNDEARLRAALTAPAAPVRALSEPARPRSLHDMPFVTAPQAEAPVPAPAPQPAPVSPFAPAAAASAAAAAAAAAPAEEPAIGQFQVPPPAAGRGMNKGRVKTRLLGFNPDAIGMSDPFEKAESQANQAFAVAWLVVVAGPGRGSSFALHDGVSKIGRGEDQTVSLNFGDNSISRENHVAVAYDSEQNAFYIGQSGRANIVRLNNKPLLSTEQLRSGDQIRVGETTLRFVALCGEDFSWAETARADVRNA